ncbi:MAG: response regulator [Bacteroidia bacterium]
MEKTKTFILIDDDPTNILIGETTIWRLVNDAKVISFTKAVEGLAYIKQHYPLKENEQTILLLDLEMPIMTGYEFINEFMKLDESIRKQIKIIVVSAAINGPNIQFSSNCVSRFISKPLLEEHVRSMVE